MKDHINYMVERVRLKGMLSVLNSAILYKLNFPISLHRIARMEYGLHAELFKVVQIQTQSKCNYNCSFCPNKKVKRPHGVMKLKLYKQILDELSDLNFSGTIEPFLMSEPFIDKRMPKLVKIVLDKCPNVRRIVFQTNGSLLSEKLIKEICSTPQVRIIVNDYTKNNAMIKRISDFNLGEERKRIFLIGRSIMPDIIINNRAGNLYQIPKTLKNFCVRPFRQLYIGFDGRVVLCCQDWKFEEIMGDLKENSIKEIWHNEKYRKFRKNLLDFNRIGICEKCDYGGLE